MDNNLAGDWSAHRLSNLCLLIRIYGTTPATRPCSGLWRFGSDGKLTFENRENGTTVGTDPRLELQVHNGI